MEPRQRPKLDSSAPVSSPTFLEVRRGGAGQIQLLPLASSRILIGRNTDVPVSLNDPLVSRLHAALLRDPYNRWWILDLGSTNGTYINGTRIVERFIYPGDTIQIGDHTLQLRHSQKLDAAATIPPPPSSREGSTTRIAAMTPERLNATLALETIECGRTLLQYEDRRARLDALCQAVVSERFPGLWAAVAHISSSGPASLIAGPLARDGAAAPSGQEPRLLSICEERRHELLGNLRPPRLSFRQDDRAYVLGSVLTAQPEEAEILFVQLRDVHDPREFEVLLSVLAGSFRFANELWETRGSFGLNAAIERELEMARQVQGSLIPRAPVIQGVDLAIGYEPSRWVGGDYADALTLPDGRLLLTIADVCGKGLQAAMIAASMHTLVHVLADSADISTMVRRMNAYLRRYLPEDSFVTMACTAIDTSSGEIECVNLGHPPPLLVAPDGGVRALQSSANVALGMADFEVRTERYQMAAEETLFLYTDGLMDGSESEAVESGDRLSVCVPLVASMFGAPMKEVCERLSQCITGARDPLGAFDDTAFLLARLVLDDTHQSTPGGKLPTLRPGPGDQETSGAGGSSKSR